VSRAGVSVSGSLAYPAFLHGLLTVAGPGLRGFPSTSASLGRSRERRPSNDLIVSFRALLGTLEPPCVGSSSPGIGVPAADVPPSRPLRGAEAPVGPAPPGAGSRSVLVVSHHLDGFLRVGVAGLLHPATGQGFTAFRACRQGGRPKAVSMPGTVPAVRFAPFEEFPSSAAGHASLRPLPSCRYRPARRGVPAEAGVCRPRSPLTRGAYPRETDLGTGGVGAPKSSESRGPGDDPPRFRRTSAVTLSAPRSLGARVAGSEEPGRPGPSRGPPIRRGAGLTRRCGDPAMPGGGSTAPKSRRDRTRLGSGRAGLRRAPSPDPGEGSHLGLGWSRRDRDKASGLRGATAAMPGVTGVRTRRSGTGCEEEIPMR